MRLFSDGKIFFPIINNTGRQPGHNLKNRRTQTYFQLEPPVQLGSLQKDRIRFFSAAEIALVIYFEEDLIVFFGQDLSAILQIVLFRSKRLTAGGRQLFPDGRVLEAVWDAH